MEIIIKIVIAIVFFIVTIGSYVGIAVYLKRRFETIVFWLWIMVLGMLTSIAIAVFVIQVIAWVIITLILPIVLLVR